MSGQWKKRFWVFVLGLMISSVGVAQYPQFASTGYTTENSGLSHNTVLNIYQDSRGFLWVGTMDGLNRFDGQGFKIYRHNPADSSTISDSFIHGVFEKSDGMLWISTRDGGFNVLNPYTEEITRLEYRPDNRYGIPNKPSNLSFEDSKGFFWIGFYTSSMGTFDEKSQQFIPAKFELEVTNQPLASINQVLELNDGSFFLTSLDGIFFVESDEIEKFRQNPYTNESLKVTRVPFNEDNPTPETNVLYLDANGTLWAELVGNGFLVVEQVQIPQNILESIKTGVATSSSPRVIIEREDYLLKGAGGGYIEYTNKESRDKGGILVSEEELTGAAQLYQDNDGNIWFATWGDGFYFLKEKQGIQLYNTESGLPTEFMLAFADEGTGTWVGTNGGLAFLDGQGRITPYDKVVSGMGAVSIWSLWRDNLGLWVSTRFNGIYFISDESLNSGELVARNFNPDNSLVFYEEVHQIVRDSRGWLWLGYQGNGVQIIQNVEAWLDGAPANTLLLTDSTPERSLNSRSIRKFYEDNDNNMWVATTDNGFNYIQFNGDLIEEIKTFEYRPEEDFTLSHRDGRNVLQQNDSTFWFASYGGGITRWRSNSNTLLNFRTNNGLANNSTYGVLADKDPRFIWASTNNGLSRLNTETLRFQNFTTADGLQNNEFNTGAYLQKEDGRLIFGGVAGFNVIDTELLSTNQYPPPVFITAVNLFNEPLESDSSLLYKEIVALPYNENFISFEFAALDFHQPEFIQFAYKMSGIDEDWVYSGNRNFADYPNLKPGDYSFSVKATNSDGVWNEEGASIKITINPPWWQTIWFRISSALLIIISFVAVIRYFSQRQLKEKIRQMEVDKKLRDERERISRDLHDHVGSQLANIMSGLSLVDKYNEFDEKQKSTELMHSLKGDAEVTIKQLRETIWALNQTALTLDKFCDHIRLYFKNQSALTSSLKVHVYLNAESVVELSSTQALNLFRIIQEASQNTLKYAEAKTLNIQLKQSNGSVELRIKDDGAFKEKASDFNGGYGMKNMHKRAREINGNLEIITEHGTEVIVKIPV